MGLVEQTRDCLRPGGRVAAAWPGFEERQGQRDLAEAIAGTLERGGMLLAEAPTGLGKSLAYLLPALIEAAHHGRRVVVATCTRALQDQLYERDVPAIAKALGMSVAVVRLKGKQNYLCPRGLDLANARGEEEEETLEALRGWMLRDEEGDLDRFPAPDAEAFRRVRPGVATDPDACTLLSCRRGRECPWVRARRLATEAQVLIVNHALLARAAESEGLLPEHDVLIVDEAHRLEDVLLSQLERSVSRHRFDELLRLLGSGRRRTGAGLLGRLRGYLAPRLDDASRPADLGDDIEALASRAPETKDAVEALFASLEPRERSSSLYGGRERYRSAAELLGPDLERLEIVLEHCGHFARTLHRFAERLVTPGASSAALELSAELEQVSARWAALGAELLDLCEASRRDCVYWRAWGNGGVRLHGVPVSAGDIARRLLGRARATVLTSATLTTASDFGFTAERLGLGEDQGVPFETTVQPSPFDLARQMRAYVYDGGRAAESDSVAEVVAELARTGRSQLVLFTAHDRLRRARERLLATLGDATRLHAQEWDGSVSQLTERFRARRGAILLGVQSLWEGVDFPGEELEIVVVAKLPFSVPDDPRVEARAERLRERGVEPFRADAVPEAVLRFRQGVGRLIRRADDRGVLVVCDPRLATASYRGPFLDALPAVPLRFSQPRELADDAAAFFASNPAEELA